MNFYSLWSNDLPWYPMLLRFLELFDQISCIYQVIPPLIVNISITYICLQSLYDHLLVNIKHCWDTYHHRYLDSLFCNKYWGCRMFVINVYEKETFRHEYQSIHCRWIHFIHSIDPLLYWYSISDNHLTIHQFDSFIQYKDIQFHYQMIFSLLLCIIIRLLAMIVTKHWR